MIAATDNIAWYKGSFDPSVKGESTWQAAMAAISSDRYRDLIEQAREIRSTQGEEAYREFKKTLPAVTFGGTFDGHRAKKTILVATGFIVADLDHLPDAEATFANVVADENTWFAFRSPSGDGVKVGLRAEGIKDDDDIKRLFVSVERYYREVYGLKIDPACCDISRLTYLSADPGAYVNPEPFLFDIEGWADAPEAPRTEAKSPPRQDGTGKAKYAQRVIEGCCKAIRESLPGNQHHTRLTQARLAGGYAHYLTESAVLADLEQAVRESGAKNMVAAMKTVNDAFSWGLAEPCQIPDLDQGREAHRARRSQQAATKEAEKAAAHIVLARLVVSSYGLGNIRYTNGSFWIWAGGVWKRTDDRAVKLRIHEKCEREITSQNTVNSILELCKTEVYAEDAPHDVECRFINCENGELHWTGSEWELRPHDRAHFSTSQLPVVYDPQAPAPRFEQFLAEVFRDDPDAEEKAVIVCEALGYSLLSTCEFEKFFLLIGNGANGKSVLLRLLEDLAGPGNVAAVQPSQFDNKFQRAHLHCKLVNLVSEIAEGAEIADAQLKAIVSGELTTVEHKMRKPFEFRPYCTCWFGTNHLPHTRDFSAALFRRAIVLTFNRTFAPSEQDQRLRDKLREELPGVLNLALEGMAGVFDRGGFTTAPSIEAAKDAWKLEADQVAQFCEECCKFDRAAQIASAELYKTYESWADDAGIRRSLNRKNFTNRICRLGAEIHKGSGGVRLLVGVQISPEAMQ